MRGCTDRVWLVFNGEIYNHAALREGLEQRGHVYASRTDSETILHLYEERVWILLTTSKAITR